MTRVPRHSGLIGLVALAASAIVIVFATLPSSDDQTRQARRPTTDVNSLMPVEPQGISAAADLVRRFVIAYGTYRFDESPETYLSRVVPLLGEQLQVEMNRSAHNQQLIQQRARDRVVATADARVDAIRSLDVGSIVFIVRGYQHIVHARGASDNTTDFAVTVTKDRAGWVVDAIQPSSIGQSGDAPS